MCEPVTIITALSLAYQAYSANQQDKKQVQAYNDNLTAQTKIAGQQSEQATAEATDQMSERAREARIERARLRVVAGESGLGGASADRIVQQSYFNEGFDISSIEANRGRALAQIGNELQARNVQTQSRINTIQRPSLIGTGLQIGGVYANNAANDERTNRLVRANRYNSAYGGDV